MQMRLSRMSKWCWRVFIEGSLLSWAPLPVRYVRGELGRGGQGNLRVNWSGCMTPEPGIGQNGVAAWRAAKTVTWIVPRLFARIQSPVRSAYPLMLDLSNRLVVIVGGGAVAARKARGLFEAGAKRVRVISPTFSAEMPAQLERVEHEYDPQWIEGATLVFAATDNTEVNDRIVRDARRLGIFVNRADSD